MNVENNQSIPGGGTNSQPPESSMSFKGPKHVNTLMQQMRDDYALKESMKNWYINQNSCYKDEHKNEEFDHSEQQNDLSQQKRVKNTLDQINSSQSSNDYNEPSLNLQLPAGQSLISAGRALSSEVSNAGEKLEVLKFNTFLQTIPDEEMDIEIKKGLGDQPSSSQGLRDASTVKGGQKAPFETMIDGRLTVMNRNAQFNIGQVAIQEDDQFDCNENQKSFLYAEASSFNSELNKLNHKEKEDFDPWGDDFGDVNHQPIYRKVNKYPGNYESRGAFDMTNFHRHFFPKADGLQITPKLADELLQSIACPNTTMTRSVLNSQMNLLSKGSNNSKNNHNIHQNQFSTFKRQQTAQVKHSVVITHRDANGVLIPGGLSSIQEATRKGMNKTLAGSRLLMTSEQAKIFHNHHRIEQGNHLRISKSRSKHDVTKSHIKKRSTNNYSRTSAKKVFHGRTHLDDIELRFEENQNIEIKEHEYHEDNETERALMNAGSRNAVTMQSIKEPQISVSHFGKPSYRLKNKEDPQSDYESSDANDGLEDDSSHSSDKEGLEDYQEEDGFDETHHPRNKIPKFRNSFRLKKLQQSHLTQPLELVGWHSAINQINQSSGINNGPVVKKLRKKSQIKNRNTNELDNSSKKLIQSNIEDEVDYMEAKEVLKRKITHSTQQGESQDEQDDNQVGKQSSKLAGSRSPDFRSFDSKALYLFSQTSQIRISCTRLLKSRQFEYFLILCVVMNCIILSLYGIESLEKGKEVHHWNIKRIYLYDQMNIGFTGVYILEAMLKILHQGFVIHKKSYLRCGYYYIDIAIIFTGICEIFVPAPKSTTLRVCRIILRPLKSINVLSSLKALIQSLIVSLKDFANVAIFMVFVFVLFATIGLQQYNGAYNNSCKLTAAPIDNFTVWETDFSVSRACSLNGQGAFYCPNGLYCGNIEEYLEIPLSSEQLQDRAYMNFGITNFDNLGSSLLAVFQMITSETWYYQIMNMMDVDFPLIGAMYVLLVIIVGQFFLLNLILAVIIDSFMARHEKQLEEDIKRLELEARGEFEEEYGDEYDEEEGEEEEEEEVSRADDSIDENDDLPFAQADFNKIANQQQRCSDIMKIKNEELNDSNNQHSNKLKQIEKTSKQENSFEEDQWDDLDLHKQINRKKSDVRRKMKAIFNSKEIEPVSQNNTNKANHNSHEDMKISEFHDSHTQQESQTINKSKSQNQKREQSKFRKQKDKKMSNIKVPNANNDSNTHIKKVKSSNQIPGKRGAGKQPSKINAAAQRKNEELLEEERKYQNNEDFTAFLRQQAQKRRIANMFVKIKSAIAHEEQDEQNEQNPNNQGQNEPILEPEFIQTSPKTPDLPFSIQIIENHLPISRNVTVQNKYLGQQSLLGVPHTSVYSVRNLADANNHNSGLRLSQMSDNDFSDESKQSKAQYRAHQSHNVQSSGVNPAANHVKFKTLGSNALRLSGIIESIMSSKASISSRQPSKAGSAKKPNTSMVKSKFSIGKKIVSAARRKSQIVSLQLIQDLQRDGSKAFSPSRSQTKSLKKDAESDIGQSTIKSKTNENSSKDDMYNLLSKKVNLEIKSLIIGIQEEKFTTNSQINKRRLNSNCYDLAFKLCESYYFQAFIFLAVIANIMITCTDRYPINPDYEDISEMFNLVYTFVLIIELLLKIAGYGFKNFFRTSNFNKFDTCIVILSLVDILVSNKFLTKNEDLINSIEITVFRGFRILRLFKLAKFWRNFQILLETLGMTLINTASFACLLLFVMLAYTLVGLEFFANQIKINSSTNQIDWKHGTSPMYNFDTLLNAFTTTFVVLTNDSQSTIFYNYYRAVNATVSTIWWLTFMIFAQKILLNVFLAILLQNYNEGIIKYALYVDEQTNNNAVQGKLSISQIVVKFGKEQIIEKINILWEKLLLKLRPQEPIDLSNTVLNISLGADNISNTKQSLGGIIMNLNRSTNELQKLKPSSTLVQPFEGRSLSFISEENKYRAFFYKIVINPRYDTFIVVCIILSAVQLALDSSVIDPQSQLKKALYWIDISTMIVFSLEAMAKIVVYGFLFNGEHSYLRGIWNILDFFILIFSYLCLTPLVSTFKVIKTLRILRSLRLVSRNEGLKVAVRALFFAIPNIITITIIMIMFYLVFAVIGISFFKGKTFYCSYNISTENGTLATKWDCLNAGGLWLNRVYNFDNISTSLVTLFVMSTTAGWAEIMYQTIEATEIDYMPSEHRNPGWIFFFIVFMIVGCFFFLNLFVGVVINTFKSQSDRVGGSELLTDKQKEWIDLRLLVLRSAPIKKLKPPENKLRRMCYYVMNHRHFEKTIQICIILNTLILMLKWYRQPQSIGDTTEVLNLVFTCIFISEAAIRIMGLGPELYFKDEWNIFDCLVALGSAIGIVISSSSTISIKGTSLLRAFRILRLLRLLKRGGKSLYLIFNTFVITMQSLANIGGLLILIMYIYSIIGMIYFGEMKRIGQMNDYINFESFTSAFITLFTIATADTWQATMGSFTHPQSAWNDCITDPSFEQYQQNDHKTVGCGNRSLAFAFFVSYMFVVSLVFLKLFIAIILEGYNKTIEQDGRLFNNDMRERFREVWSDFDPDATTFIKLADIRNFMFALGGPLGFDESFNGSRFLQDKFIAALELPTYHNFETYQFLDILDALSFRLMVLDNIRKVEDQDDEVSKLENCNNDVDEKGYKSNIEKEVNRLIFQKQSENIVDFKELWEKEQKKKAYREKNKDQTGLTSSHHMALEAAIRRIKVVLAEKRRAREELVQEEIRQQQALLQAQDPFRSVDVFLNKPMPSLIIDNSSQGQIQPGQAKQNSFNSTKNHSSNIFQMLSRKITK